MFFFPDLESHYLKKENLKNLIIIILTFITMKIKMRNKSRYS